MNISIKSAVNSGGSSSGRATIFSSKCCKLKYLCVSTAFHLSTSYLCTDQKVAAVQNRGRKQCLHFEICKLVLQNPMEPLDRNILWNVVLHDLGTEHIYRSPRDICITTMEWTLNNLEAGICIPTNCSACNSQQCILNLGTSKRRDNADFP